MEDSQNSIIINTIHDEITALRSRELKYNKKSITAISSPAHRSEEDHCCRLSPVNVVAIDRICTSSFNDAESRLKVCEWMYKIVDHFQLERETIHVGMSLYERYMGKFHSNDMHQCQLIAVASLYIAVKIYERTRKDTLSCFCKLCEGRFSEQDIEKMEIKMLTGLDWLVNPPTPQAFIYLYTRLLATKLTGESRSVRVCSCIYDVASYISELSLLQTNIRDENASTIASASFLLAITRVNEHWLNSCRRSEVIEEIFALGISADPSVVFLVLKLMKANLSSSNDCLSVQEMYTRLDPNGEVYEYTSVHVM